MTEFTPFQSLIGGALIGLSSVMLLGLNGKIAGISGIASKVLNGTLGGASERPNIFFIVGLVLAAPLWLFSAGGWPAQTVSSNPALMAIGGVLVGFGAVLGNGCTSGHGVCGLSRLSARSIVATLTFMASAAVTLYVSRHWLGFDL